MTPAILNGWLTVPYNGSERSAVHISTEDDTWIPAYLDWVDGERVAKIRVTAPAGTILKVRLRAGSSVTTFRTVRV